MCLIYSGKEIKHMSDYNDDREVTYEIVEEIGIIKIDRDHLIRDMVYLFFILVQFFCLVT